MSQRESEPTSPTGNANASPNEPQREGAGTVLGQYRIVEAIGEGGFGTVYRAEQTHPVQRSVALKILKLGMDTRQVVARFEAERQALALMDHPAIAKVYDAGATETGRPYFVMELVDGEPLTDYCDHNGLDTEERLQLFGDVCLAVQHAHQKGVLHRDLKPSNVLVTEVDGVPLPKVIDFGIAKATERPLTDSSLATEAFQVMGTPEYMPPEQAAGRGVDTRADVYALGVMLYELLTGTKPFVRATGGLDDLGALLHQIHEVTPPKPSTRASDLARRSDGSPTKAMRVRTLRGDLDWIVMKAIEKDRERRYDSAAALADDIRRHLASEPVLASPPSATYRFRKFVRRNRLLVAATGVVATTVLVAAVLLVWGFFEVRDERDAARVAREDEKSARQAAEEALDATELARQEEARAREAESEARATAEAALEQAQRARQAESDARAAAEEALEEANEVTAFLTDMLGAVDPEVDGLEVTVRQVLDRSARDLATRFSTRPRIHGRLALTVGSTYQALGAPQVADPYLEEALRIVRDTHGPDSRTYANAVRSLGALRIDQQRLPEAFELLQEWSELARAGDRPLELARARGALGHLYSMQGKFDQAERELLEAIEQITALDPNSLRLAGTLQNLGVMYAEVGRHAEAHQLMDRVYRIRLDELGPEHPRTLVARRNRVPGLRARGELEEASREALAVLEASRRVTGRVHPETLEALQGVAGDLSNNGRFDESIRMYREVVAGKREVLGERHPEVAESLRVLGIALWKAGHLDEAALALDEAVELFSAELGPDHPGTLSARNLRAIVEYERGRFEQALRSWTELARVQERIGDPAGLIDSKSNIAMVQADLGLYAASEAGHIEAIELATEQGGPQSRVVQYLMNNLAALYVKLGRLDEAEALNIELIEIRERVLGPNNPLTMTNWGNLAIVYAGQGRYAEALDVHTLQLDQRLEVLGPEHRLVGDSQMGLGHIHHFLGDLEAAEPCYRAALAIYPHSLDADAFRISSAHMQLGILLRDTGRMEEAEEHLVLAFENTTAVLGEEHDETLKAAAALAMLYGRTDRPDEELALWKRILNERERQAEASEARAANHWAYAQTLLDAPDVLADPERALAFALRASEKGEPDVEQLATLARAHGAAGDDANAARLARAALEQLPEGSSLRAELEGLL